MKRLVFILVLALVAGVWIADEAGYLSLPWRHAGVEQAGAPAAGRGGRRRFGAVSKDQPVPVLVGEARTEDVPVTIDSVGTVQALNTVTVRAQVDGRLVALTFKDGQDVKKGDVLARIDPVTYQAAYDQVVAKKAQDEAQLANARTDLERYQKLAVSNYGSKQQADTQKATVAQLEAQLRSDQASIDNAKAILAYTTITAPIDGRTGIRAVDAGNIVHASDATGIVTITQLHPIALLFALPQQNLAAANAALARGEVKVQALQSDNAKVIEEGRVEVVDNQVDPTTGTVRVKAVFPNDGLQLWPGQFVNVRLFVDVLKDALVIPAAALQRGPDGAYVYRVENDVAKLVNVSVLRQDESQAVLAAGPVKAGDRLVTTGFSQLTDGHRVRVDRPQAQMQTQEDARASAAPQGPAEGRPRNGRRGGRRTSEAAEAPK